MKFKNHKDIVAISNDCEFGFRLICNLSPREMSERKEEIIRNILKQFDFEWDSIATMV